MTYQLIAVRRTGLVPLGRYPTYRQAEIACDEDRLAALARVRGRRLRLTHHIVGPGPDGAQVTHPHVAELGEDRPRRGEQLTGLLAATAGWLAAQRGGAGEASG